MVRRATRASSGIPVMEECEQRRLFVAITEVPILHSAPNTGAVTPPAAKLFLDFNGAEAIPDWLGSTIPATPAYDTDNNANDFTAAELNNIRNIWARVAEKYSPFNLDVTTEDPGNQLNNQTAVVIIGGDGAWLGAEAGGVAPLGGFYNNGPNVGFVFSALPGFDNHAVAEATAHEAGHLFGLEHHSLFNPDGTKDQEYDPGNFLIAPVMGVSYSSVRGLWAVGPSSPGPNVIQDDLAVLTGSANGFGYRIDDYGGNLFSGLTLDTSATTTINQKGIIERTGDVDAFIFSANSGTLNLNLQTAEFGPMLNARIQVFDAFGTLVAESNTASLDETLVKTGLTAGTYIIQISGSGNFGDLGQYTLTGTMPGGGIPPSSDHLLIQGTDEDDNIEITLVEGSYHVDLNGDVEVIDANTIKQFDILAGGGNDAVTLGPGVAKAYVLGGAGSDTLRGGDFNDTLTGSGGNDQLFGFDGDDRLSGSAGSDILVGGNGRDRLYGDDGNDVMTGGSSVDRMYGGEGNDVLSGESGADKAYGEAGNDTVYGGNGTDLLNAGDGLDQLWGSADNDTLYSRDTEFDMLNGGAGEDTAQTEDIDTQDSLEILLA